MERIRRCVRDVIGYQSLPYRATAFLATCYFTLSREGLRGLALLRMANRDGPEILVTLRSLQHPILVRPGSQDIITIVNNVLREEYGQLSAAYDPKIIVDAGAYIGDTAAYFLTRFQDAVVIALEPGTESHARALRNLAPYHGRVHVLKRALWNTETTLRLSGDETSASISGSGEPVETDTIPGLMSRYRLHTIDLLKLDIEGAETTVIPSGRGGWLRRIRMIVMETHGAEIERATLPILASEGYACRRYRNVWYCTNTHFELRSTRDDLPTAFLSPTCL